MRYFHFFFFFGFSENLLNRFFSDFFLSFFLRMLRACVANVNILFNFPYCLFPYLMRILSGFSSWSNDYVTFSRTISAIIGIVGCADALKATSLIFGRVPNANKTTTSATTTTTSTVATVDADHLNDEEVSFRIKSQWNFSSFDSQFNFNDLCLNDFVP